MKQVVVHFYWTLLLKTYLTYSKFGKISLSPITQISFWINETSQQFIPEETYNGQHYIEKAKKEYLDLVKESPMGF